MNKKGHLILGGITMTVTVFIFFLLAEKKEGLFYFNVIYALILEALLFGFLFKSRLGPSSAEAVTSASAGTVISFYTAAGAALIIVYNLFLNEKIPSGYYIAAVIVLTLIAVIATGFIIMLGSSHAAAAERQQGDRMQIASLSAAAESVEKKYARILEEKNIQRDRSSNYSSPLEKVTSRIKFLSPNVLKDEGFCKKIEEITAKADEIASSIRDSSPEEQETLLKKMKNHIEESSDYIETQSKYLRN